VMSEGVFAYLFLMLGSASYCDCLWERIPGLLMLRCVKYY